MAIVWRQNSLGKWEANGSVDLSWEQIYHSPEMRARLVASGQLHSAYLNQKSPAEEKYELTGWTGQSRDIDFPQVPQAQVSQALIAPVTSQSNSTGILNGKIFDIDTKLLLIAVAAYFVFAKD